MKRGPKGRGGRCLVVGCGSALRGDDAAGLRVAERIARWRRKDLRVVPCHQLAPELAEDLAGCDLAVFVDAFAASPRAAVRIERLDPDALPRPGRATLAHACDPSLLLEFTQSTYGRHPEAWVVGIPAARFDLGRQISGPTQRHMRAAEAAIRKLLDACQPAGPRPHA